MTVFLRKNHREGADVSDLDLQFTAPLWVSTGAGAWHFVTVPTETAAQIRFFRQRGPGFGTLRVTARIGQTGWQTSLFPDKASGSFFLPVKAEVRRREALSVGQSVDVTLRLTV